MAMRLKRLSGLIFMFLALVLQVGAEVVFSESTQRVTAAPDDRFAELVFEFTNKGTQEVRLTKVDTGCNCLGAELDQDQYEAGAKGKLRLRYKLGTLKGTSKRQVAVNFSSGQLVKLNVEVTVPELFMIEPKTQVWLTGEAAEERIFKIKVTGDKPIHIKEIKLTSGDFDYELKTIEAGRDYELMAKPKATDQPCFAMVRIQTDSEILRYRINQAFLTVSRPPTKK